MQQDNNLYDEMSKGACTSSGENIGIHKLKKRKAVTLQNKCGFRYWNKQEENPTQTLVNFSQRTTSFKGAYQQLHLENTFASPQKFGI